MRGERENTLMEKLIVFLLCLGVLATNCAAAVDTIAVNQTLKDGDTIVSAGENFELGFFSPNNSKNRYLGIRSKRSSTRIVVWVSNRGSPLNDTSGVFKLMSDGRLLLLSGGDTEIWSSDQASTWAVNPVAQLLDSGNLVVRDGEENILWQSNPSYYTCVNNGICGSYASCNGNNNSPTCDCFLGFEPSYPEKWNLADWSDGCQRRQALTCGYRDGFGKISGVEFLGSQFSSNNMRVEECEMTCRLNCSCTAYANSQIRNLCFLWFDDIEDMKGKHGGQELYARMSMSELAALESGSNKLEQTIKVVAPTTGGLLLVGLILALFACRMKKRSSISRQGKPVQALDEDYTNESHKEAAELPFFSLSKIANSTNNFSSNNKLGQGGFGPVYKGVLEGREIAVKRLSKTSNQGLDEFKNEVRCIARLQHRNLVKLLGYCIQGDETMLIYEYMPNKSLDSFIFDESKSLILDWPLRFHIINGIARGLLYLHQDSRLRIIHRDLKAGNILLDVDMNPKISDFGLARRFRGHESEANTNKVVGTLGYISPEYAANGQFSIKSDVFSFGVLLLEIVSGKKNRGFSDQEHRDNLIGHAWRLYKAGKSLEMVSASLCNSFVESEVVRTIHIGLLCVQHHAEDRPTMSSVVLMLGNEGVLPPPKQPAFFADESLPIPSMVMPLSIDNVTITILDGR